MTDKDKAIRWFENIADECDKLTSGNVAHLRAQIKGMAIRSAEHLKKHNQEPTSEELEREMDRYFETMQVLEHENIFEDTFQRIAKHFVEWQREQMMKDAIDSYVKWCNHGYPDIHMEDLAVLDEVQLPKEKFKIGDKVKVIIIKE